MSTRAINLDPMFRPVAFPEIDVKKFKFSGGETQVKLIGNIDWGSVERVVITNRVHDSDGIIDILLVADAVRNLCPDAKRELIIPYLPYGRQDRVCSKGEALSLKVFGSLINSAGFDSVMTIDAHNTWAAGRYIKRVSNGMPVSYIKRALASFEGESKIDALVCPDEGAHERLEYCAKRIKLPIIFCEKHRNPETGQLSGFSVNDKASVIGKNLLIVDDICDGGGTFIGTSSVLKEAGAKEISLFTTHGIYSNGFCDLAKSFNKIFSLNSFNDISNQVLDAYKGRIEQFKIQL